MKRASDTTIQQRTANAQRKDVYWSNIILALIPVVNGFYYFGAGGRVGMVAVPGASNLTHVIVSAWRWVQHGVASP